VETIFRTMKGQPDARPIFHETDDSIRGHVFCSSRDLATAMLPALQPAAGAACAHPRGSRAATRAGPAGQGTARPDRARWPSRGCARVQRYCGTNPLALMMRAQVAV
jgi:hypothetical protein